MAPALVPTTNGQQSKLSVGPMLQPSCTTLSSESNPKKKKEQKEQKQHQLASIVKAPPLKLNEMSNLKSKLGSVPSAKETRVYKIVLTGGK